MAIDFYQQKTNDELLFFIRNPTFYQPDLVDAARQELRRRGVAEATPPLETAGYAPLDPAPASEPKAGRILTWLAAALLLVGGGYLLMRPSASTPPVANLTPKALELTTAPSSPLPNYEGVVAQCVKQQLQHVPTREKAMEMNLNNYRELTRRFWAAETLTEFITAKARREPENPILFNQIVAVQNAWYEWRKAMAYSYKFGPKMADHLDRMQRVARQQQESLEDLAGTIDTKQPAPDEKTVRRDADVQDLLAGLLPKSPVSHQPYRVQVRHINL